MHMEPPITTVDQFSKQPKHILMVLDHNLKISEEQVKKQKDTISVVWKQVDYSNVDVV